MAFDGWSISQYKKNRKPLPAWYLDRPEMAPGDPFYLQAFWRLTSERQVAPGYMGVVPWSRIREYADREGLDDEMFMVFEAVMAKLDETFIEVQSERKNGMRGTDPKPDSTPRPKSKRR